MKGSSYSLRVMKNAKQFSKPSQQVPHHVPSQKHQGAGATSMGPSPNTQKIGGSPSTILEQDEQVCAFSTSSI